VRVLVVDDDALVRSGLIMMIDGVAGIEVVAEAGDGDQVPAAVDAHHPDVVLMDIRMPRVDGITATARLATRAQPPKVIVLTTFDSDDHIIQALRAGAAAFLLKDTPPKEIVEAIRKVAAGQSILSPQVTRRLMDRVVQHATAYEHATAALAVLSRRERQIVQAVAQGRTNAEIAAELYLSLATVKTHVSHILARLGLANRTQLALLAHDARLIQ
jgi:DNA-binding NarL/FixJ family response regulator